MPGQCEVLELMTGTGTEDAPYICTRRWILASDGCGALREGPASALLPARSLPVWSRDAPVAAELDRRAAEREAGSALDQPEEGGDEADEGRTSS